MGLQPWKVERRIVLDASGILKMRGERCMFFSDSHILSMILFTPLVGAILLLFIPRERDDLHRWFGNVFGFLGLLVSLPLIWRFSLRPDAPRFQFSQNLDWIPSIGAHYSLGIDGISFLLVMLTTLLGAISILSSWCAIKKREKEYYILFLLLADGHAGRLHVARFLPLLPVLGSDARPDVFPDRRVGQRPPALCGDQILPVYAGRIGADAAGDPGALLQRARRSASRPFSKRRTLLLLASQLAAHGSSGASSSPLRSRCRCSRSTPGCPTRTPKRPRPAPSSWPASC